MDQIFDRTVLSFSEFSSSYLEGDQLFDVSAIRSIKTGKKTYISSLQANPEDRTRAKVVTPVSFFFQDGGFKVICLGKDFKSLTINDIRSVYLTDGSVINIRRNSIEYNAAIANDFSEEDVSETQEVRSETVLQKEFDPERKAPKLGKNKPSLEYEKILVAQKCDGDKSAMKELVERHLWLAGWLASRYYSYKDTDDQKRDIESVAFEALTNAVTKFEMENYQTYDDLEDYSKSRIKQRIRFFKFDNASIVRPGMTNEKLKAFMNFHRYMKENNISGLSDFSVSQIIDFQDEFSLSDMDVQEVFMMRGGDAGYIDAMDTLDERGDGGYEALDEERDYNRLIRAALGVLDEDERSVLGLMLSYNHQNVPAHEREELNLTRSRFSQLKKKVAYKLGYYFTGDDNKTAKTVEALLSADVDTSQMTYNFNVTSRETVPLPGQVRKYLDVLGFETDSMDFDHMCRLRDDLEEYSEEIFSLWPEEKKLFQETFLTNDPQSVRQVALNDGHHVPAYNKYRQRALYRFACVLTGDRDVARDAVLIVLGRDDFTSKFNPDVDVTLRGFCGDTNISTCRPN